MMVKSGEMLIFSELHFFLKANILPSRLIPLKRPIRLKKVWSPTKTLKLKVGRCLRDGFQLLGDLPPTHAHTVVRGLGFRVIVHVGDI